jgi:uncharacterized protein
MNDIRWQLGLRVPLRDGLTLSANLYLPEQVEAPVPAIMTLTPYGAQIHHDQALEFARRGFAYLVVDSRGRSDSQGSFTPYIDEAEDGHDAVEWLAKQSFCNGKVGMWGPSYSGLTQWLTARTKPAHLTTIVPTASPFVGVDFPQRNNISYPYVLRWLSSLSGRSYHRKNFDDTAFWSRLAKRRFEKGLPFATLGEEIGYRPAVLDEWTQHPTFDAYWGAINPAAQDYARMDFPILTITGAYDADQPGALEHYRRHLAAVPEGRATHYLVMGPWDHGGAQRSQARFGGIDSGDAALVDLVELHMQWYRWTMCDGPRPGFLRDHVAYYVIGANCWRYAPSLEGVTSSYRATYLSSNGSADSIVNSGQLVNQEVMEAASDTYVHDPRILDGIPATPLPTDWTDQSGAWGNEGHQFVYHGPRLSEPVDLCGFFRLTAWLSINTPDTDFHATIFEVNRDGSAVLLTDDILRARHRDGLDVESLIATTAPIRYEFKRFHFVGRRIAAGSRLRLVIAPINSPDFQKNYNAAKPVSAQCMADAQTATVRIHYGPDHPSALFLPIGAGGVRADPHTAGGQCSSPCE